jgi:hypothetical protein
MATKILKSINQSDVPTDFNSVNNSAKIQKTNPSDRQFSSLPIGQNRIMCPQNVMFTACLYM